MAPPSVAPYHGIFSWIAAHAAEEQRQQGALDITPYWRTLKKAVYLTKVSRRRRSTKAEVGERGARCGPERQKLFCDKLRRGSCRNLTLASAVRRETSGLNPVTKGNEQVVVYVVTASTLPASPQPRQLWQSKAQTNTDPARNAKKEARGRFPARFWHG